MADLRQLKIDIERLLELRVKPANGSYDELGRKIKAWATDPSTRPELNEDGSVKDLVALKEELAPFFTNLPNHIEKVIFVQPDTNEYYIRLPAKELVALSDSVMQRLGELTEAEREEIAFTYPMPFFYKTRVLSGEVDPDDQDFLMNRIGDYTFAHCA